MVCQTSQRELVQGEWVELQVISGQSGITEPAVTCAVSSLSVIRACRPACAYPYVHTLFIICTENVKTSVKATITTLSLPLHGTLWEGAGKDAIAP